MLNRPEETIELAQTYKIQLVVRNSLLRYSIEVAADPDDEWIIPDPQYSIGDKVWIVTPDLLIQDWEQKRIFGIELYAPRWDHGSLITEPAWYFGVKALMGRGESQWLPQEKITQTPQTYDFESDVFY